MVEGRDNRASSSDAAHDGLADDSPKANSADEPEAVDVLSWLSVGAWTKGMRWIGCDVVETGGRVRLAKGGHGDTHPGRVSFEVTELGSIDQGTEGIRGFGGDAVERALQVCLLVTFTSGLTTTRIETTASDCVCNGWEWFRM